MKSYQISEQSARDSQALEYESWYIKSKGILFDMLERSLFRKAIKNKGSLLDIGSWTGRITEEFIWQFYKIVATDFSMKSVDILNSKFLAWVEAYYMDATQDFPFENASFDSIMSCQVIQHFQVDDLLHCLNEIHRVMKQEGEFVFSVYNYDYFWFHWVFEDSFTNGLYVKRFNIAYLKMILQKTGFIIKGIRYYWVNPILHISWNKVNMFLERTLAHVPYLRRRFGRYILVQVKKYD